MVASCIYRTCLASCCRRTMPRRVIVVASFAGGIMGASVAGDRRVKYVAHVGVDVEFLAVCCAAMILN